MNRTVQYWRLLQPDGAALPGEFPAEQVVRRLSCAEAEDRNRYRRCPDGMLLIAHGTRDDRMLILDKVRRENLPSIGSAAGARRAIGLTPDEGLLEPTYCLFGERNIVAMLTSGDGPRARRLADYLEHKLEIAVGIEPVLTQNLDQALDEMSVSRVDVAIPADRINRELVGGDWVQALDGARALAHDGVVRIGISVGRRGTGTQKEAIRRRIRELIDALRGSGALSEFESARVVGSISGTPQSVDLLEDKFVEKTRVDADRLNDPERSTAYARELLRQSLTRNRDYLLSAVPAVPGVPAHYADTLIEVPGDERE
ncbi:oxidoreductase [Mycobacterium syngnathidarum]|uniref:Oxidoreductase n=1 Tax=Mycobacterium syngnathidarum TaxID=1908205 RepID=A0A1Q9WA61_9MYCO|nr:oxidoreductase [Mycobacterium syngnathidarum]OLT95663.1 oxidoreductase [Mycobacterium syngnathidarum]